MKVETDVEVTETVCHEDKIAHLQMIQGVIDRMSTSAAIYKGFAATIVTGIAAISFTEVSAWILLIAFFPVGCFLVMDTYYLKLEKQYRILYEKVRNEKIAPDFSLDSRCSKAELHDANATSIKFGKKEYSRNRNGNGESINFSAKEVLFSSSTILGSKFSIIISHAYR